MSKSKWRRFAKPQANKLPLRKANTNFSLILYGVFAIVVLSMLVVDAHARSLSVLVTNPHSTKNPTKVASSETPVRPQATVDAKDSQGLKLASKTPIIVVPQGVDEGNKVIAQGSGASNGGAVYDPMRRIVKIVETTGGSVTSTKQFVWAGDQLCEERDASGNVTKRFFALGEQIAGTNYYYNRDHLGSITEMTNNSGVVQAQYRYSPWGEVTKLAGTGPDSDMQYAGMYKHQRSGLNLAVNRAYNPSQGHWISRDTIDDPAFALVPQSPEPNSPDAMSLTTQSESMAMVPILSASNDPIVQAQLMKVTSQGMGTSARNTEQTNSYVYGRNNPVSFTDRSGLGEDDIPDKISKWALCNIICTRKAVGAHAKCMSKGLGPIICGAVYSAVYAGCMAKCLCTGAP